jgi:ribosomal protein S18 acetylase RimI-like enzyme
MISICLAEPQDAQAILNLQRLAYESEARLYDDWSLPPLTQTLQSLLEEFETSIVLKAVEAEQIVGSVRAKKSLDTCMIGRLIVHPAWQRRGFGSMLLAEIESKFPDVARFELFTGSKSEANIRLYQRLGYEITHTKRSPRPCLSRSSRSRRPLLGSPRIQVGATR